MSEYEERHWREGIRVGDTVNKLVRPRKEHGQVWGLEFDTNLVWVMWANKDEWHVIDDLIVLKESK